MAWRRSCELLSERSSTGMTATRPWLRRVTNPMLPSCRSGRWLWPDALVGALSLCRADLPCGAAAPSGKFWFQAGQSKTIPNQSKMVILLENVEEINLILVYCIALIFVCNNLYKLCMLSIYFRRSCDFAYIRTTRAEIPVTFWPVLYIVASVFASESDIFVSQGYYLRFGCRSDPF